MNQVQMEIHTTRAQLQIDNKLRTFTMKSTPPEMTIERKAPSFKVNWDDVYSESGLKRPKQLMESSRQKAYNKVMNAIKRTAQEGDMMMDITNDAPPMVPIIAEQNMRAALPEVNLGQMPENFAEFDWDTGGVEVNWSRGSMEIVWDEDYRPDISVTPHSVEIKIRNFKKVKMNDTRNKVEGRQLDKRI